MFEIKGKYASALITTDNIEEEAIGQITELVNNWAVDGVGDGIVIMPDCLHEDTEVLTSRGFVKITSLLPQDLVANYHMDEGKVDFRTPTATIVRDVKPNEKVFVYKNELNNYKIVMSENHRLGINSNPNALAKEKDTIEFGDIIWGGELEDGEVISKYSNNDLRLLAWIVGDGSFKYTKNKDSINTIIRFGLKKERKIKRLLSLLDEEGLHYNIYIDRGITNIRLNTKPSNKYLQLLDFKKHYPIDFLKLSSEQSKVLLDELIQVDGDFEAYLKRGSYSLSSTNYEDLSIISALASLHGIQSKIKTHRKISSWAIEHKLHVLTLVFNTKTNKGGFQKRKLTREEIDYDGKLVCIECDSSYFVARQNGLVFVTGNCHAGKGCVIGTTIKIKDRIVPNLAGVDIGCGVLAIEIPTNEIDLEKLDKAIHRVVPSGTSVHQNQVNHPFINEKWFERFSTKLEPKQIDRALKSIGTLGGGRSNRK